MSTLSYVSLNTQPVHIEHQTNANSVLLASIRTLKIKLLVKLVEPAMGLRVRALSAQLVHVRNLTLRLLFFLGHFIGLSSRRG